MMSATFSRSLSVALASATVCWMLAGTAFAQTIGTTTEARNQVTGERNSNVRRLSTGSGVSARETVSTGRASSGVFRFTDGSNLNVGEQSSVVLDRFVYDPNGGSNAFVRVGKGAMRFTSGSLGGRATVVTPGAVLGIRN